MSPQVRDFLSGAGVDFKVHAHAALISYEESRQALQFDAAAMVKALAFKLVDGRSAIVAMRAGDRADYKKIADTLGARRADLRAASIRELDTELGMEQGGIVALPINGAQVLIDRAVLRLGTIYCGTGRSDATLEIAAAELARISGGVIADLAKTS